jgi:hypothetical protein
VGRTLLSARFARRGTGALGCPQSESSVLAFSVVILRERRFCRTKDRRATRCLAFLRGNQSRVWLASECAVCVTNRGKRYRCTVPLDRAAGPYRAGSYQGMALAMPQAHSSHCHPSMKTGAPVHRYFCGDADRLLFALEAHKVCPDSTAPSERRSRRARMTSS